MSAIRKIICLAVLVFILFSCQKKARGYVEVKGRVLDYFTHDPISTTVELRANDIHESNYQLRDAAILLSSSGTKADGSFDLRSKPSKDSEYYLWVTKVTSLKPNLKENSVNDLGNIYGGSHTFSCSISFIPRSDSSLTVGNLVFSAGTYTQVMITAKYGVHEYEGNKHNFCVGYETTCKYLPNYSTNNSVCVPIVDLNSILTTTVYY